MDLGRATMGSAIVSALQYSDTLASQIKLTASRHGFSRVPNFLGTLTRRRLFRQTTAPTVAIGPKIPLSASSTAYSRLPSPLASTFAGLVGLTCGTQDSSYHAFISPWLLDLLIIVKLVMEIQRDIPMSHPACIS